MHRKLSFGCASQSHWSVKAKKKCYGQLGLAVFSQRGPKKKDNDIKFPDNIENSFYQGELQKSRDKIQLDSRGSNKDKPICKTSRKKYNMLAGEKQSVTFPESKSNTSVFGKHYLNVNKNRMKTYKNVPKYEQVDQCVPDETTLFEEFHTEMGPELVLHDEYNTVCSFNNVSADTYFMTKGADDKFWESCNSTNKYLDLDISSKQLEEKTECDNDISMDKDINGLSTKSNNSTFKREKIDFEKNLFNGDKGKEKTMCPSKLRKYDVLESPKWLRAKKPDRKIFEIHACESAEISNTETGHSTSQNESYAVVPVIPISDGIIQTIDKRAGHATNGDSELTENDDEDMIAPSPIFKRKQKHSHILSRTRNPAEGIKMEAELEALSEFNLKKFDKEHSKEVKNIDKYLNKLNKTEILTDDGKDIKTNGGKNIFEETKLSETGYNNSNNICLNNVEAVPDGNDSLDFLPSSLTYKQEILEFEKFGCSRTVAANKNIIQSDVETNQKLSSNTVKFSKKLDDDAMDVALVPEVTTKVDGEMRNSLSQERCLPLSDDFIPPSQYSCQNPTSHYLNVPGFSNFLIE